VGTEKRFNLEKEEFVASGATGTNKETQFKTQPRGRLSVAKGKAEEMAVPRFRRKDP